MKVFGTDILGCLTNTPVGDEDGVVKLFEASPLIVSVNEMQKWVMEGWVPSIVTELPVDDVNMTIVEGWLAKSKVPYSNLLMGVESFSDATKWLNLSFMITKEPWKYHVALAMNKNLKLYVMRNHANKAYEEGVSHNNWAPVHAKLKSVENIASRIKFVDSFKTITELENA